MGAPLSEAQRRTVLRQVLATPAARQVLFDVLHAHRETAMQGVLATVDPALIYRAQGRVQAIDAILEEYTACTNP